MARNIQPLGIVVAPFLLAACSGTTVVVELTDAPPDTATIEHVYVSLDRVELHVAGDDGDDDAEDGDAEDGNADPDESTSGWRTVAAPAGTFDLVALRNDVRATLGELELGSGKITQIRLFIEAEGQNEVVLVSGERCALDLRRVPTTGVKINHPFKALDVEDSDTLRLVVDFDLVESLDQTGPCAFTLKPVIKLKHVEKS
ncbi:MAG TPA: DUF4382 domain-containing protein [Polyangiaceae bacterium]